MEVAMLKAHILLFAASEAADQPTAAVRLLEFIRTSEPIAAVIQKNPTLRQVIHNKCIEFLMSEFSTGPLRTASIRLLLSL